MSRRLAVLVAVAALLLSACASMPSSGPIVEAKGGGDASGARGTNIDPKPPQPGDTRADIVRGFLVAMQATPTQLTTAKEFLTHDAAASWAPDKRTVTYSGYPPVQESAAGVRVQFTDANWLDSQGAWQGALPAAAHTIDFPMAFEGGEWRIDKAPDALIVPETWFAQRYRQVSLYYFDPTASILAPEPVFVPSGRALASALTQALLVGPGEGLDRVVQSFIPPGLTFLSVTVSDDGVADIPLKGDAGQLTADSIPLMMAQLAWTLRQESDITALRVTINGDPVPLPDGEATYRVDGSDQYDPAGYRASPLLYGLRNGLLASGTAGSLTPVAGPMGTTRYDVRSIGVSLTATMVASVTTSGGTVRLSSVSDPSDQVRTVLTGGHQLLPPAWDFADRFWLVDRTSAGAKVSWSKGGRVHPVEVPGVTGERVRSFVISRDGTRMVAVVRHAAGDVLVVSRIAHDRSGRVLWATPARPISDEPDSDLPVRAIAWGSPTSLAVLSPFPATTSLVELSIASVDGSPAQDGSSTTVEGRFSRLAGSPVTEEPLYGVSPRALVNLSASDRRAVPLEDGTTAITYVG